MVCPSKSWSICNACKNACMRGSTPKGRNVVSAKCPHGLVIMSPYNFFACGPKFMNFFSSNVEGALVDKILFPFAIYRSVPEIFTIKVESC